VSGNIFFNNNNLSGNIFKQMKPEFFESQADFRKWLEKNHETANELIVGFYKVGSGKPSMTWPQSVDEALCFGWIDGIRRTIDGISYSVRFTPRRPDSNWSEINIKKVAELSQKGLMKPAGLAIFNSRKIPKQQAYTYEERPKSFPTELENMLKSNPAAWNFFHKQAPSYQLTIIHWIISAKQEITRQNRMEKLIKASAAGKKLFA
jgi:uncharacterized protein YdeI (YjbR/CyaY-like superfamily)